MELIVKNWKNISDLITY